MLGFTLTGKTLYPMESWLSAMNTVILSVCLALGEVRYIKWNELYQKLSTCDQYGYIIVWVLKPNFGRQSSKFKFCCFKLGFVRPVCIYLFIHRGSYTSGSFHMK